MSHISDDTRAGLTLCALRLMRGAAQRTQDRAPGSAWDCQVERWLSLVADPGAR